VNRLLNYPGQKWGIAKQIVDYFPEHTIYLEPFCGSLSVFFNKPRARSETVNDLDGDITNLFTVIREQPEEFSRLVFFTPYSKQEFLNSYDREDLSDIERARRFLTGVFQSQSSSIHNRAGWRRSGLNRWLSVAHDWTKVPDAILEAADRLRGVEIERKDALELIPQFNSKDCLIYCDPPYIKGTRKLWMYKHEFYKREQHENLLEVLLQHKGTVVLSGYDNELYENRLNAWNKVIIKGRARNGSITQECIWINKQQKQIDMFNILERIGGGKCL
jgi:DNA adenine methylase